MPFNTKHVMNTILERSFKEGRADMTPMKAQKILFYTNGWHLATTGTAAVSNHFEVWTYGPVIPIIYHDLKHFGHRPITNYIKNIDEDEPFVVNPSFKQIYDSIDIAWDKYIGIPATALSAMTHEPGSPWDLARSRHESIISNEITRDYFVRLARAST